MIPRRAILAVPLVVILSIVSFSAAGDAKDRRGTLRLEDPLPVDSTVTMGRLENGFRYYIKANQHPENRAYLYLAVNAGSILEDEDQLGLAHFVEHMGFNGTKHFPKQELVKYLQSIGFGFGCGGGLNAYTSFDQTIYTLMVPTDTLEALEKGILILEDWARWALLEDEEIEKERGVVLEEWRLWRGPQMRLLEKELPVLFAGSRYAERLPIGTRESIEAFKPETLRRFYQDWYRPDLMAVVAVGDFDAARIEKLIREHFSDMPPAENPRPRLEYDIPHHSEMLFSIANDPEETGTMLSLYFKSDPSEYCTVSDYRRKLILRMHDSMFNRRLSDLSRTSDAPILRARTLNGHLGRTKDVYVMSAWVPENGIEKGLEALLTEVARIKYHGFTQAELDREKSLYLRIEDWKDLGNRTGSGYYIVRFLSNFLRGDPVLSPDTERELNEHLIAGVTLDDVNGVLTRWFETSSRSILASMPEKESVALPGAEKLRAIFNRIEMREAAAVHEEEPSRKPLIAKKPAPGRISEERSIPEIGVSEWTLSNGARIILKPTDYDKDKIFFHAFSPGGSSLVADADYRSVASAFWILEGCGAGEFDGPALKKRLMGTIAHATPYVRELAEGIEGKAYAEDMETMFQLLYLRFTAPRTCPDQFAVWQRREREAYRNKTADPRWAFRDTVQMMLSQYHPRRRPMTEAMIDSIDLDAGFRIIKNRFADASDFTFIFYGDFDIEELKPLVCSYIGSLPALHRAEVWRDIGVRPPEGLVKRTVYRGIEPQCDVQIYFEVPYEWSRENQWICRSLGEILRNRLRNRVREDMGGTYSIFAGVGIEDLPYARCEATIHFSCAPERADELIALVFANIDSLKTDGPDEQSISDAKERNRRHLEYWMERNSWWGGRLEEAYFRGEDPREILREPECAAAIDAAGIRDAARRIFDMDNYALFVRLPERTAAGTDEGTR